MSSYDNKIWYTIIDALCLLTNSGMPSVEIMKQGHIIGLWKEWMERKGIEIEEGYTLPMFSLLENDDVAAKVPFYAGLSICETDPHTEDGLKLWEDLLTPHAIIRKDPGVVTKQWNMYDQLMQLGSMAAMLYAQIIDGTFDEELKEVISECMNKQRDLETTITPLGAVVNESDTDNNDD